MPGVLSGGPLVVHLLWADTQGAIITQSLPYRPEIDGLRAIAVLAVMVYHAAPGLLPGGFLGVDVFFVISGYLITGILLNANQPFGAALRTFWLRRIRRIFPALLVCVAGTLLLGIAVLPPAPLETLGRSALTAIFSVSNFFFWRQPRGYFEGPALDHPLIHTWSLGVEEQFYLFYPLLLLGLARWRRALLLPALAAGTAFSFVLAIWLAREAPSAAFYLLPARAWELGVGALVFLWSRQASFPAHARIAAQAAAWLALLAVAASFVLLGNRSGSPGYAALPAVVGTGVIIALAHGGTFLGRALSIRPVVGIGLISYSAYLWHQPLLVFTRVGFADLPEARTSLSAAALALSLVLAWLSWRLVEQPLRRGRLAAKPALAMIGAAFCAVLAIAVPVVAKNGLPERLSAAEASIIATTQKEDLERRERGRCSLRNDGWRLPPGTCVSNREIVPTIALVGDSHASALYPALGPMAAQYGQSVVLAFAGRCRPVPPLGDRDTPQPRCRRYSEDIVRYLDASPSIRTVVVSYHWNALVEGASGQTFDDDAARSLENLLRGLAGNNRRVIVSDPMPMPEVSGLAAAFAAERRGGVLPDGESTREYRSRTQPIRRLLDRAGVDRMARFDPGGVLCDSETGACPLRMGGQVLWRDRHHLTSEGATVLLRGGLANLILENGEPE